MDISSAYLTLNSLVNCSPVVVLRVLNKTRTMVIVTKNVKTTKGSQILFIDSRLQLKYEVEHSVCDITPATVAYMSLSEDTVRRVWMPGILDIFPSETNKS